MSSCPFRIVDHYLSSCPFRIDLLTIACRLVLLWLICWPLLVVLSFYDWFVDHCLSSCPFRIDLLTIACRLVLLGLTVFEYSVCIFKLFLLFQVEWNSRQYDIGFKCVFVMILSLTWLYSHVWQSKSLVWLSWLYYSIISKLVKKVFFMFFILTIKCKIIEFLKSYNLLTTKFTIDQS